MAADVAARLSGIEEYFFARIKHQLANSVWGRDIINLAIGDPDFAPPKEVINALVKSAYRKGSNGYQPSAGTLEFRKAAANWYKSAFGISLNSEKNIISLIGSKEGIFHISLAYLNRGSSILAPDPGYPVYGYCASLMQAKTIYYDLAEKNKWQIDLTAIEKKISKTTKIIWLNSPHMPTGSTLSKKTFTSVIQFAKENNILVIHDNPYAFILNKQKPFSILSIKGAIETSVELCSLSKSFNMPGFRVGIAAGNSEALSAISKTKSIIDSGSYLPIQQGAIKALSLNSNWFTKLNHEYKERKTEVIKLAEMLNCSYKENTSGMFLWTKLPGNEDDKLFYSKLLNETGIFVAPGSLYGKNGKGFIRISLCQPVDKIKIAQKRIEKIKGGLK